MWLLKNTTPFAADNSWIRDIDGSEVLLVVIKATARVQEDGRIALEAEQREVCDIPKFRGEPECSSLLYESDFVLRKIRTDVLVEGRAFAPSAKAVSQVDVRIKIANIDKTLRVHGDRVIENSAFGIKLSHPKPFFELPIFYEKSYGGTDLKDDDPRRHDWEPRNPVGVGFATSKKHILDSPAPNVEYPKHPYVSWKRGVPAGFGPIARHWAPRVGYAGTYDADWEENQSPLLPLDFDKRFYQCAPDDQQANGFLQGGEVVEMFNLSPEGHLSFRLPSVSFRLTSRFYDGSSEEHRADLHTVVLHPDKRRFELIWHSGLPCHHKVNKLRETTISIKRRVAKGGGQRTINEVVI
jgi:hypothetical protein